MEYSQMGPEASAMGMGGMPGQVGYVLVHKATTQTLCRCLSLSVW